MAWLFLTFIVLFVITIIGGIYEYVKEARLDKELDEHIKNGTWPSIY